MEKQEVMLADSSEAFCADFELTLREYSEFEFVGAFTDGNKTVRAVKDKKPDILVLDLMLPKKDGLSVLNEISSMQTRPAVIATTNYITDYVANLSASLGAQYLFTKPVSAEEIIEHIQELLGTEAENNGIDGIELERKIAKTLHDIGVPADIKGYRCLKEAIMIAVENMEAVESVSKEIYVPLANRFKTTPRGVESAIRGAIEIAWDRGDLDTLQSYFGYTVSNIKGRPTNSEFIALVADKLQLQLRCEKAMGKEELPREVRIPARLEGSPHLQEAMVASTLFQIGIPADIKGYRYLKKAIMIAMENIEVIDSVSKEIYIPLANQFQTAPERVQSAIHTAIEIAWDRGDLDTLQNYFGYSISNTRGKPTNSEFIALVAETLRLQLAGEKNNNQVGTEEKTCDAACLVSEALREVGIPDHLKGSQYLREAILLAIADESAVYDMRDKIYAPVEKLFMASQAWVKKAIAHAILVSWDETGDLDVLMAYFGYTISNVKGYPSISEFIALFAERIRLGLSPIGK